MGKCPNCDGSGKRPGVGDQEGLIVTCLTCRGKGTLKYNKDCDCPHCNPNRRNNLSSGSSSGSSDDDQEFWGGVGIIVGLFLIVSFLKFLWDTYIFPFYKNYVEPVIDWLNSWNGVFVLIALILFTIAAVLFIKIKNI